MQQQINSNGMRMFIYFTNGTKICFGQYEYDKCYFNDNMLIVEKKDNIVCMCNINNIIKVTRIKDEFQ